MLLQVVQELGKAGASCRTGQGWARFASSPGAEGVVRALETLRDMGSRHAGIGTATAPATHYFELAGRASWEVLGRFEDQMGWFRAF